MTDTKLVSSAEAGRTVGLNGSTLNRAVKLGQLTPTQRTPGGHNRWDVADLRRQLVMRPAIPENGAAEKAS